MSPWQLIMSSGGELLALAMLLGLSAFFSGAETALFSLSGADLVEFAASGSAWRRRAALLAGRPRRTLAALLLANQLVNVAFFAVSSGLLLRLRRAGVPAHLLALLALAPLALIVIFGEVCPKNIAIAVPRLFAALASWPLQAVAALLQPVNLLLVALSEPLTRLLTPPAAPARLNGQELHRLMELSGRRGLLAPDETRWISEVLRLGRRKVAAIMVHRLDMICFDIDQGREKLRELFQTTGLAKLPVYRRESDNILGFIYARRLILARDVSLYKLIEPPVYVPEQATVEQLLVELRRRHAPIALVVDEYGGIAGLVTLEDAAEEIVGDLATEGEREDKAMREVAPGEYLVDASLSLDDWAEVFGESFEFEDVATVGGALIRRLQRMPSPGDSVVVGGVRLTVETMSGRRVRTLRVRMDDPDPEAGPGGEGDHA